MPKDKRISELPGISPAAVVALNRMGLLTVSDLVNADYDRVAVVLEDFNEASRLIKEARLVADTRKVKDAPGGSTPAPLAHGNTPTSHRAAIRTAPSAKPAAPAKSVSPMNAALASVASDFSAPDWRETLMRRFDAVSFLLGHNASPTEVAASLTLEAAEAGEVSVNLTAEVENLLEECIALRTVPVLPSGKLPRYYLDMASRSSLAARRVCAAALLACLRAGGRVERADLLAEALTSGEQDPLIDELGEFFSPKRAAA
jgi:hypothetical protein